MEYKHLILEREGPVAVLTVNRPEAANALNSKVLDELSNAVDAIAKDAELRVVILTGAGPKAFIAGADIGEMAGLTPVQNRHFAGLGAAILRKMETMDKVWIAAINGYAFGGGLETAMACDIRYMADSGKPTIGLTEVSLGIIPAFGGTQRLPRLVGPGKARELIYTAGRIDAQEALRIGLVQAIFPPDKLMAAAKELAAKICANAPLAVAYSKAAIDRGMQEDIDRAQAQEIDAASILFSTDDKREGLTAFGEKRKPAYRGK
jgi:enoyl-CoA hydratase